VIVAGPPRDTGGGAIAHSPRRTDIKEMRQIDRLSWIGQFAAWSGAGVVLGLIALWLLGGFAMLGLDAAGVLALLLGIALSAGVGIGLMALIFHSSRSGRDEAVYRERPGDDRR